MAWVQGSFLYKLENSLNSKIKGEGGGWGKYVDPSLKSGLRCFCTAVKGVLVQAWSFSQKSLVFHYVVSLSVSESSGKIFFLFDFPFFIYLNNLWVIMFK